MNKYDKRDMVSREQAMIAGPIKIASYRVRDPETLEWSSRQYHLTFDNTVMAVMGEEAAKLFIRFVQGHDAAPSEAATKESEGA